MKKRFIPFLSLALLMCVLQAVVAQQVAGDSFKSVKAKGSGVIAVTYVETPGFIYKDPTGKLTGVCIDIMQDFISWVEDTHDVKLNMRFVGSGNSFKSMYDGVKLGKDGVVGLGNITITDARKREIEFSPPFIKNFAILISQSSVPTLTDMSKIGTTFASMKAYTARGTLNERRILEIKEKHFPGLEIQYAASSPETLAKILQDPKSFAYLDVAFYLSALKDKQPVKRHDIADQGSEEFGFIMPKNSDWAAVMQEFFADKGGYTNSASYKKILVNHLGVNAVRLLDSK
jgi:ABC-type amino acid transport substrate-binding protein